MWWPARSGQLAPVMSTVPTTGWPSTMDATSTRRSSGSSAAWANSRLALSVSNCRARPARVLLNNLHIRTGTSQYMYVEFVTSPAGPLLNTGFHFNVGNWPGHVETAGIKHGVCDWLLSSDSLKDSSASEGIFLSIAHWYPPNTSCSYHIKGHVGEIVRLYFPR